MGKKQTTSKAIIVGIDPGLTNIGIGIIIGDSGTTRLIQTTPGSNLAHRLLEMNKQIVRIYKEFGIKRVTYVALERQPQMISNEISIMTGALCGFLKPLNIELIPPTTLKKMITHNGFAKKEEVSSKLSELSQLVFYTDHESDAFALAYVVWSLLDIDS